MPSSPDEQRSNRSAPRSRAAAAPVIRCLSRFERQARERGFRSVAGVDEVGRGALFGPVFAAAVILDPDRNIGGLADSKVLESDDRSRLARQIKRKSIAWAVGAADAFEIDQINIYQASRLAMKRAVQALAVPPDYLLVDAIHIDLPLAQEALIDGDARCRAIAAASIVAKVTRDECMARWHAVFPQFNLAGNKGYSTPDHKRSLEAHGPTALHRFSFEPVRQSSALRLWTGYEGEPVQESLFDAGTAEASRVD